jgi:hypothetical protein
VNSSNPPSISFTFSPTCERTWSIRPGSFAIAASMAQPIFASRSSLKKNSWMCARSRRDGPSGIDRTVRSRRSSYRSHRRSSIAVRSVSLFGKW